MKEAATKKVDMTNTWQRLIQIDINRFLDIVQSWIDSSSVGPASENNDSESTVSSSFACDMVSLSTFDVSGVLTRDELASPSFISANRLQNFGNVNVQQSSKIHIGNNVYLNKIVYMTQNNVANGEASSEPRVEAIERSITTEGGACILQPPLTINNTLLKIVPRRLWLAQPPLRVELLKKPVPFVIIGKILDALNFYKGFNSVLSSHGNRNRKYTRWDDLNGANNSTVSYRIS